VDRARMAGDYEMTTTPTPQTLAKALLRELNDKMQSPRGDYYVGDMTDTDRSLHIVERHIVAALTEQARDRIPKVCQVCTVEEMVCPVCLGYVKEADAHPECHPAALCDGPEQAREIAEYQESRKRNEELVAGLRSELFRQQVATVTQHDLRTESEDRERVQAREIKALKEIAVLCDGYVLEIERLKEENERLLSEAGYHDAADVIRQLTAQRDEIQRATWEAATESLDRAATTPIPVSSVLAPTMEAIRDMIQQIADDFRARAAAPGGKK